MWFGRNPDSDVSAIYAGGVIAPGVHRSVEALVAAAAKLPSLAIENFDPDLPVLGTSTQSAMKSGVLWGYVGLIDGLLNRLKQNRVWQRRSLLAQVG